MAFPDERLIERVNIPSVLFERRATLPSDFCPPPPRRAARSDELGPPGVRNENLLTLRG
jgi:hypothetical protein